MRAHFMLWEQFIGSSLKAMRTLVIRPPQGYGNMASFSYPDTWVRKPDCFHLPYIWAPIDKDPKTQGGSVSYPISDHCKWHLKSICNRVRVHFTVLCCSRKRTWRSLFKQNSHITMSNIRIRLGK